MYSIATGMMPAAMIAETQLPAASGVRNPIIIGRAPSGDGTSFTVAFGDDAELAFGADDQTQEIVAVPLERGAADLDDRAVDQHHFNAEDVVRRHAVLEAVRAAEFIARLPAIVQASCEDGSGA